MAQLHIISPWWSLFSSRETSRIDRTTMNRNTVVFPSPESYLSGRVLTQTPVALIASSYITSCLDVPIRK
jgi:hypothetical protein